MRFEAPLAQRRNRFLGPKTVLTATVRHDRAVARQLVCMLREASRGYRNGSWDVSSLELLGRPHVDQNDALFGQVVDQALPADGLALCSFDGECVSRGSYLRKSAFGH